MSIASDYASSAQAASAPTTGAPSEAGLYHRLGVNRRQEHLSRRTVASRMNVSIGQVAREEESADLPISALYRWQQALEVPIGELLVDAEQPLARPIRQRAQLVRVMKSAVSILQRSRQTSIRRMAQTLVDQLLELMPELKETSPWPAVGRRRRASELGQAAQRQMPAQSFFEGDD